MLIGYSLAPRQRYTVGHCGESRKLYRYDIRTGKTWLRDLSPLPIPEPAADPNATRPITIPDDLRPWKEIPEPNKVLPLPKK